MRDSNQKPEKTKAFHITHKLNTISEKYTILASSPIREFSSIFGQAFDVNDLGNPGVQDKFVYVFDPSYGYRMDIISEMMENTFTNIVKPIHCEILPVGEVNHYRLCAVFKKPAGITLRSYVKQFGPMSEQQIMDYVIPIVTKVLMGFEELGQSHGGINPDNIYINNVNNILDVTVGDAIREPCGFSQPAAYEVIERMQVMPIAKGVSDVLNDYFSLGITVVYLTKGNLPAELLSLEELVYRRIEESAYEVYCPDFNGSAAFKNMVKGLLCDRRTERWGTTKVIEWLKGRRFNFAVLRLYKKATRIFNIGETKYYTTGSVAQALYNDWDLGKKVIKDSKFVKWVEGGIANPEMAERLSYTVKMGSSASFINISEDEILCRCIMIIDPENGIRYKSIALHIEGFGSLLCHALSKNIQDNINHIYQVLDSSLINMAMENRTLGNKIFASYMIMNLERFKLYAKKHEFGFGMERLLYEFNTTLVCQSPLVINYYCFSVARLLTVLNDICEVKDIQILDRHISAFIAAKLNFRKEVRISTVSNYPEIESNRLLRSVALLSIAQREAKVPNLPNLTKKYAASLRGILTFIKSKTTREEVAKRLDKVVELGGILEELLNVCCDVSMIKKDNDQFQEAQKKFLELETYIMNASNNRKIFDLGYNYGLKIAMVISYFVCTVATVIIFGRMMFDK
ncbi:MAG: hypothetical protein J0G32_01255 [Alphaproteobacteria bacterium]|nr:hypothetical protein [Alphaproteobacteria bacterium]OJV15282.1 MAG: hypothetical protein BGO27_02100 [Alphaproteobacteria bacterium 33-17]